MINIRITAYAYKVLYDHPNRMLVITIVEVVASTTSMVHCDRITTGRAYLDVLDGVLNERRFVPESLGT